MPKPKNNPKYVQVCPQCKSVDVSQDKSTLQQIGELPTRYICNKCGHSGFSFPEVSLSSLKSFEDKTAQQRLVRTGKDKTPLLDDSYGNFQVRFIWKLLSPILVLLGVVLLLDQTLAGIAVLSAGLLMGYITYFKARKLKVD